MRKATRYARTSALPAIAAALALSSTTALAQEAQPTTPDAVPQATAPTPTPAPVDAAPVAAETPDAATSTPVDEGPGSTPSHSTAKRTVHHATTPASGPRTVAKTVSTHTTHATVPAAAVAPVAPAATTPTPPPRDNSAVKPIVDMTAADKPATAQPTAAPADNSKETAMEIGGGALALLAIGAGALALSRRRRHEEDEAVYDETYEPETAEPVETAAPVADAESESAMDMPRHDPVHREQANIIAPEMSAFSWADRPPEAATVDDGSDRNRGETWVERAYRGPSPANPSASLKNRLRRAAFFDKRERDVAEGKAEPIDTDAGLPDAMIDDQERELA